MSIPHRRTVALAICAGLVVPPAAAQNADPLIAAIKTFAADLAQGRACKWITPFDEIALTGKIADTAARAKLNFGAQAAKNVDAAMKPPAKTDPCDSQEEKQKQSQVMMLRLEWLTRADVLYAISESAPFGKDMTALGPTRALVTPQYQSLRKDFIASAGQAAWDPVYKGIIGDSRTIVGLTCTDRMNVRTKEPRKCPNIPDSAKKFMPLAVAQLKSVEAFAASYNSTLQAGNAAAKKTPAK